MREQDILHENGDFWVMRDVRGKAYAVMKNVGTHSVSESAYPLSPDGLSIAKARCNYLAKRRLTGTP